MPNTMDGKDALDKPETPKKLVNFGMLFGIRNFLREKEGNQLFVCDGEGARRFELKLNSRGDVCFLDGRNLRLLDRDCGDLYLEGESVRMMDEFERQVEEKRAVRAPAARNPEVCGFNNEVLEAVQVILGVKGRPAPPEKKENADVTRLTKVLDIIGAIDRKYTILSDHNIGCRGVIIRYRNQNGAMEKVDELILLGCEVRVSACFIDARIECSNDEEKEVRRAGHKFTVIY